VARLERIREPQAANLIPGCSYLDLWDALDGQTNFEISQSVSGDLLQFRSRGRFHLLVSLSATQQGPKKPGDRTLCVLAHLFTPYVCASTTDYEKPAAVIGLRLMLHNKNTLWHHKNERRTNRKQEQRREH